MLVALLTRATHVPTGVKDANPGWGGVTTDYVNRKLNDFKNHPRVRPEETPVRTRAGRPRALAQKPGLEASLVQVALDAEKDDAPMSRQDVTAEINQFLQQTDDGQQLLAKFRHGAVDKKVISRLVQASEGAIMEKIKIVDVLRASWTTHSKMQAYYEDIFAGAVEQA